MFQMYNVSQFSAYLVDLDGGSEDPVTLSAWQHHGAKT